jgi:hypothetical protein
MLFSWLRTNQVKLNWYKQIRISAMAKILTKPFSCILMRVYKFFESGKDRGLQMKTGEKGGYGTGPTIPVFTTKF